MATASALQDILDTIEAGPRGRSTAAFFAADGAAMAGTIADAFRRGRLPVGRPDPAGAAPATAQAWQGKEESEVEKVAGRAFARGIADRIYAETRELIATHRRKGHTIVLTSSALRPQIQPVADALDVDDVICTEVEVADGHLTGRVAGPVAAGDELVAAVERYASASKIDLARSHAYASADTDAQLLTRVGNPHPTNPQSKLAATAGQEKWTVLRFESRGRPGPQTIARSLAAYGVMVPSMLTGVGVRLLNGDRHAVTDYGVANWVERMFALTGVTLNVQGEENLWSQRPAVFIYNHRNNFDPYVAIRLVRRGWGSVAKREIAGPLTGVMQWLTPNVAFLDRSDAEKAVEGLRPVTELLHGGVSVMVAPEGTRSRTGKLGRFKKGAFRMAMDAGVPLVPIVIRNADQVADREAFIIRKGTIDVKVLPPIPVESWTLANLDERIDEVRQLFVDTLANWPR